MKRLFYFLPLVIMVLVSCQKEDLIDIPSVVQIEEKSELQILATRAPRISSNKYAIIINGGYNSTVNQPQYWNDCSIVYKMLKNNYGYTDDNIYVIMSDGTGSSADLSNGTSSPSDLDGNGTVDIDFNASLANMNSVFTTIGNNTLNGGDVFVYVTGPMATSSSFLGFWNNSYVSDAQFAEYVSKISTNARMHILMNVLSYDSYYYYLKGRNNTTLTMARHFKSSGSEVVVAGDRSYSRFTYNWVAAMVGNDPDTLVGVDADFDNDANVSFLEAFKYASNFTHIDDLVYSSNSKFMGYNHGLDGKLFDLPLLTGPQHVDINATGIYRILNLPPSATVTWQYPNSLIDYTTDSSTRRLDAINTNLTIPNINVYATVSVPSLDIAFPLGISDITYWKSGVNMDEDGALMTGFFTGEYGEVVLACDFLDVTSYTWTADNGFLPANPGNYAVTFTLEPGYNPEVGSIVNVIASFLNPLGQMTHITRNFVLE